MAQTKARRNERTVRRTTRGKVSVKGQATAQVRPKKFPSKSALRQLAKDWDHVT